MIENFVSIILPTYNRAYCLPDTIESLLSQTYTEYEIIVIDDESTDGTQELFATRYVNHPKIKYLTRKNGGCGAARNTGIKVAQGEFIAICDSDDIWQPWKLEMQIACLKQLPEVGLLWTDLAAVGPDGKVLHERYAKIGYSAWKIFPMETLFNKAVKLHSFCAQLPAIAENESVYVGDLFSPMMVDALINIPTEIIRRKAIDQVGLFDETMRAGEDYDFNLRVCAISQVAFLDVPSIAYRIGAADQLTRPEFYAEQARNCIKSILPFVKNRRQQIKLSDNELRKLVAAKYRWLGNSEFDGGRRIEARNALLKSLWYWPSQPQAIIFVMLTLFPPRFVETLRVLYRKIKPGQKLETAS